MSDCSIEYFRTLCKLKPKQIEQVQGYYKQVRSENEHLQAENDRIKADIDKFMNLKETFDGSVQSFNLNRIDRLRKIVVDQVEEIDRLKAWIEELQRTHDIDRRRWALGREEEAEEGSCTEFDE